MLKQFLLYPPAESPRKLSNDRMISSRKMSSIIDSKLLLASLNTAEMQLNTGSEIQTPARPADAYLSENKNSTS